MRKFRLILAFCITLSVPVSSEESLSLECRSSLRLHKAVIKDFNESLDNYKSCIAKASFTDFCRGQFFQVQMVQQRYEVVMQNVKRNCGG